MAEYTWSGGKNTWRELRFLELAEAELKAHRSAFVHHLLCSSAKKKLKVREKKDCMAAQYLTQRVTASFPSPSVLLLSLNRPPVNAFNTALWLEVGKHFVTASKDPDCRVVVLASAVEKMFTAGLDLSENSLTSMGSSDPARTALLFREHIAELQDAITCIEKCDKPVIAAVHGVCFGGGIDIIAACDIRYAAKNSLFSIKEVDVGLAADIGSLQRLPSKVASDSLLRELALTARNFNAAEAAQLGLVSKVVDGGRKEVLEAALETAKAIASKSPIATLGTKHLLNYSKDHTVDEGLEYTRIWNMAMLQAEDLPDAFKAFATKKPAVFKKLGKL